MDRVAFLPGDGQGPAAVEAAARIVEAADASMDAVVCDIGSAAYERYGELLPYETLDAVSGCRVIVSGPTLDPGDGHDPLADLMSRMDLFGRRRRFRTLAEGLGAPGADVTVWGTSTSGTTGITETRDVEGITIAKYIRLASYARMMGAAMSDLELRGGGPAVCIARDDMFPEASASVYEAFDAMFGQGAGASRSSVIDWIPEFVSDPASYGLVIASDLYAVLAERLVGSLTGGERLSPVKHVGDSRTLILPCGDSPAGGPERPVASAMAASEALWDLGRREESARVVEAVSQALSGSDGSNSNSRILRYTV